jgi:glycosyltransferase involved in cell wall biosynthesis
MTVDVAAIRRQVAVRGPEARAEFRIRYGIDPDAMVVLFVGRLAPEKGVDTALAAWADLHRRYPKGILVIVGDGELRRRVDDAASSDPTIRAIGRLAAADVWEAYAAADLLIGSSPAEGWGLVVNEAMAAGLPVVVTDGYGCVCDLVRHGKTGMIVQADNPTALSLALHTLLQDETLRIELATNAGRLISDWTIEAQADRIARVWERVLQRGPEALQ